MNKEPTEQQIRELWEWCGFKYEGGAWQDPNGKVVAIAEGEQVFTRLPDIDLNNLFKYAVAKLEVNQRLKLLQRWVTYVCATNPYNDPATTLFWALWQVKEEK